MKAELETNNIVNCGVLLTSETEAERKLLIDLFARGKPIMLMKMGDGNMQLAIAVVLTEKDKQNEN